MAYTGRAPSAAPLTSGDITDGAVAPVDLSTGAPSWDTSGNLTVDGTVTADGASLDGAVVINESGADVDFRVESDTSTHALFVQGSDGNISIGNTSPELKFRVSATSFPSIPSGFYVNNADSDTAFYGITRKDATTGAGIKFATTLDGSNNPYFAVSTGSAASSVAGMSWSERMRIDSSGSQWIGATSLSDLQTTGGAGFYNDGSYGRRQLRLAHTSSVSRDIASFYGNGSLAGTISCSPTATAYNTSSDYRLKEDWQPMSGSIDRLKNLNPVNFAWKADGSRVDGFLAHEAAEVVPEAVTGEKDAMRTEEYEVTPAVLDDDGNVVTEAVMGTREVPEYQGIDQAKLVPLLTAALQEAVAKIEALETRIAALEV